MNKIHVLDWQNPFVDVFKKFNAFDDGCDKKGAVDITQNNDIARKVFKLSGKIPASNYISIPKPKSDVQSLGLNGRYIYFEFISNEKNFTIHVDLQISGRNPVKFSISNMFDSFKVTSSNTLQIPFAKEYRNKWCVFCLDIEHHLASYGLFPNGTFKNYSKIYAIRSIQICADLTIRGVYTSDNLYNTKTLPKELDFKMPKGKWEDSYNFIYFPSELANGQKKETKVLRDETNLPAKKSQSPQRSASPPKQQQELQQTLNQTQSSIKPSPIKPQQRSPEKPAPKPEERSKIPWLRSAGEGNLNYADKNESLLALQHVLGFTGRICPDIKWSQNTENNEEVFFAAGNVLVGLNHLDGAQRFFMGHDGLITCLEVSRDGNLLATAQSERNAAVRLWDFETNKCVRNIPVKLNEINSISLSHNNKLLSVAGIDQYKRDTILIFNIEPENKKNEPVAKQVSEFNILSCKFSPIESDKLVSCGKENIRFWRIKNDHFSGGAVVLNHHARDTVFTVLEFDFNHENPAIAFETDNTRRVFVGSKNGLLFQVNYVSRELEAVFKIHDSCICSLAVSQGFCVTGSEDQYLRVWPLDFSEYFLEAKHEGVVISLSISHDALKVTCGISSGGLGVLDLTNQSYRTILRSHTERIKQIEFHPYSNNLVTLSDDLTIRVWDSQRFEQLYEFTYSREDNCTGISCFPNGPYFAAGFHSGVIRVFDIENTCIIEESKYHNTPVCCILYSPNGKYLITGDKLSNYNLFDVERNFQPVKIFEAEVENENPVAVFSHDSRTLITSGAYTTTLNIWDLTHFFRKGKILIKNTTIKAIEFSADDTSLSVLGHDGKIRVYGIRVNEAILLREVVPSNKVLSNSLSVSGNRRYLLTGCNDTKVRVWDLNNLPSDPKFAFPQSGHSTGVTCAIFSGDNTRVFTAAGEEGVYVWEFRGDAREWIENNDLESFSKLSPIGDITPKRDREISQMASEIKETKNLAEQIIDNRDDHEEFKQEDFKSPHFQDLAKMTFSNNVGIRLNTDSEAPLRPDQLISEDYRHVDLVEPANKSQDKSLNKSSVNKSKLPIIRKVFRYKKLLANTKPFNLLENARVTKLGYLKNSFRENNKLPFRHYALETDSRATETKNKDIFRQRTNLSVKYHIGYNNDAHQNVVWNTPGGWFAYGSENYVVIENLTAERSQRLMNFSDVISCLALSRDGSMMAVGAATNDSGLYASVHLVDCLSFKVFKTLKLHTKGIQGLAFSHDGRYLISVGNYKECTLAIWDTTDGKLVTSSYTLTNINDIKIKPMCKEDNILEFTTVGGDQIIQWILTSEEKLLHQETFIQPKSSKFVELTCLNYVFVNNREYGLIGTSEGEVILFDLSLNEIEFRRRLLMAEIVDIVTNNDGLKAYVATLDSNVFEWDYSEKLKIDDEANLKKFAIPCVPCALFIDEVQGEGLIGSVDGGVFYCNFKENLFTKLVGTTSTSNNVVKVLKLSDNIFATIHYLGGFKLWNAANGEELADFAYEKINCKTVLYNPATRLIHAFYDDNTIKTIDFDDFSKVSHFVVEESMVQSDQEPRYFVDSGAVVEDHRLYYFAVTNKGEIYTSELKQKEDIEWIETGPQTYNGRVCHFRVSDDTQQINIGFDDATIQTYKFHRGGEIYPEKELIDEWNIMEDPHGDLDKNAEEKAATLTIYGTKINRQYAIQTAFSESRAGIVFVSTNYLQYVLVRNAFEREIVQRIPLNTFPSSLEIDLLTKNLFVGLDDGWILILDEYGEEVQNQRNYNDGAVVAVRSYRAGNSNNLLAVERKAFTIYNYQI